MKASCRDVRTAVDEVWDMADSLRREKAAYWHPTGVLQPIRGTLGQG